MAINRGLAIYIVIAMTLAVTVLAGLSWMTSLTIDFSYPDVWITGVQFDNGYLTITVKNNGTLGTTKSEVTVNQTSTLHTVPVHELIGAGEQISIRIGFKWTSGYTYQIKLKPADNTTYWWHPVTSLAVAP